MSLGKQEFTNAGRAMLGRAQNGETLTITKIVVGSGSAASEDELWPLTELIEHQLDVTITTKRDYGDGTMLVEGSFNSDQAPTAFYLKEVGVMAHAGTGSTFSQPPASPKGALPVEPLPRTAEADRLYSVSNVLLEPADYIDPAVPTIQAFKIKLVIDRIPTDQVVVQIGPSENVIGENLDADTVGPGWYHEAAGNVLKFKRAVEGPGIELLEAADEHSIEISVKQLRQNVDLYVPESHPDAPNPDVAFPTIQAAHDYLKDFRIPADKLATIHVYKGTFTNNTPTLFDHPDSQQIHIIGYPRYDKQCSSITFVDSTHKRLAIPDITNLVAGTRGYLTQCAAAWSGGCQISSTPLANYVTASIEKRDTRGDYQQSDSSGSIRFRVYPTVIDGRTIPAGINPVFSFPYGIGSVRNLCIVGGWASISTYGGTIRDCQLWGATRGINSAGSSISLQGEVCITQCDFGITGLGQVAAYESPSPFLPMSLFLNACNMAIYPSGPGFAIGTITGGMNNTLVYMVHNWRGVNCSGGATMIGGSFLYSWNDTGFLCDTNATLLLGQGMTAGVPQGNQTDLKAATMGFISYDRHGALRPPQIVPSPGNPGEDFGFIRLLNNGVPEP